MLSQLNVLSAQLGTLPATALERPDAIEDFKARYANRAIATTNRYLARLRHVCNWAIGRDLLTKTAFHPRGVRIPAKAERRRERRVSDDGVPVHELQLLAGHSSITTTQRYMNARASSLAKSMRQARVPRVSRVEHADEATAQIG